MKLLVWSRVWVWARSACADVRRFAHLLAIRPPGCAAVPHMCCCLAGKLYVCGGTAREGDEEVNQILDGLSEEEESGVWAGKERVGDERGAFC